MEVTLPLPWSQTFHAFHHPQVKIPAPQGPTNPNNFPASLPWHMLFFVPVENYSCRFTWHGCFPVL